MAKDQAPDGIPTETSYSDPLYDRLERAANWLGKRWIAVVIGTVLAVVIALVLRSLDANTPEAASNLAVGRATDALERSRLGQMGMGGDPAAIAASIAEVTALIDDEGVLPKYRAKAAISLSDHYLVSGDTAAAITAAERAVSLAQASDDQRIVVTAHLSLGAANEDAGNLGAALSAYTSADQLGGSFPTEQQLAAIYLGRVLIAQGDATDDQATSETSYRRAIAILSRYARPVSQPGQAQEILNENALFLLLDLYRRQPHLKPDAAPATTETAPAIAPATEAPAAEATAPAAEATAPAAPVIVVPSTESP